MPDGFTRIFDFHNHPGGIPFFSDSDFRELLESWGDLIGQVAVSQEGSCIALKTGSTETAVKKFGQKHRLNPELAMEDLWNQFIIRSNSDISVAARGFNIAFCQETAIRLIFVPKSTDKMKILV